MRAGKLRRRASLQRKQVTQDGYGAEIASWAEFAVVAAGVEPLQGREFWTSQAEQGEISTRITIRFRDDVKAEDRVVWGDHTYDIEAVVADERGRELQLMCKELVE
jgi:SPP1 family predicted phage head-tail adaptor